jgi:hypothetical protein
VALIERLFSVTQDLRSAALHSPDQRRRGPSASAEPVVQLLFQRVIAIVRRDEQKSTLFMW